MKSLYLLRHAKSSWKDPGLNDHDRPLSKRGRQTAKMMAAYIRRSKIAPDLVICSTAARAQQTLDPIAKAKKPPKILFERAIYEGTQQALWEQLWSLPESAKSVLLIGHNPALQDFALELAKSNLTKRLPSSGEKFPTGAMAAFRFDGAWKAMRGHQIGRPKPDGQRQFGAVQDRPRRDGGLFAAGGAFVSEALAAVRPAFLGPTARTPETRRPACGEQPCGAGVFVGEAALKIDERGWEIGHGATLGRELFLRPAKASVTHYLVRPEPEG